MKKLVIGILAHVDAGKTTLAESILFQSGSIKKPGRVDHGDAFLDHYALERERGITIFTKQAVLEQGDTSVTLLDTPGHVDFGAEAERTLRVLDYAILVLSAADGIQGHTLTLWKLLKRYEIPVFLFFNKMDQTGIDRDGLVSACKKQLSERCVPFDGAMGREAFLESLAYCDESVMEHYLENGDVGGEEITRLITQRRLFPCYFGSALKMTGVSSLLDGLRKYTRQPDAQSEFGARVFKITRDAQGNRLTHIKITGGVLRVKDAPASHGHTGAKESPAPEEKVNQLRVYTGAKYETVQEADAGTVCAVTGLAHTRTGQGLGCEPDAGHPALEPVLRYQVLLPQDCDAHRMLLQLKELEEEEPQLQVEWNQTLGEMYVKVMGEVQTDILKRLVWERFQTKIAFGAGRIVYKETVTDTVEGVGHFEPLRHYAEVHLLLEPGETGSGLTFASSCGEDELDKNWQRLILTHLSEKEHRGVLTGSAITDMKITLAAGKAHPKHTEGGDFRQATYRAVRQGLSRAHCILLEPFYEFRLELPAENVGRAMSDIQKMSGIFEPPRTEGAFAVLTGSAPVFGMQDYQRQVIAYTRGRGRLSLCLQGYAACHNAQEVIEAAGYDAESDENDPVGSIFCARGSGFYVNPSDVPQFMHLESCLSKKQRESRDAEAHAAAAANKDGEAKPSSAVRPFGQEDQELAAIFERTYGSAYRNPGQEEYRKAQRTKPKPREVIYRGSADGQAADEYLLVDGYNIIFAWEELKKLAELNLDAARYRLLDILSNYQGFRKGILIVVFDAYRVKDNPGELQQYHNIHVVYTKEAETADQYIEKTVHQIGRKEHVTVATSDGLEQLIITGQGARLLSARELLEEIRLTDELLRTEYLGLWNGGKRRLFDSVDEALAVRLEQVRRGETSETTGD